MATMKDVALRANVSVTTVSATLSGVKPVSAPLRERVLNAIDELGYFRNSIASGLKSGRTSLIGLIVPDITNPFFNEFVERVQREAIEAQYTVLLGISDGDVEREKTLVQHMRSNQVAGIILCPTGGKEDYRTLEKACGSMKLVTVDNAHSQAETDTVTLDNFKAATITVEHILSHGHKRVAVLVGPDFQEPAKQRLGGFLTSMEAAGHSVPSHYIERGEFKEAAAFDAGRRLLELEDRPTAVFVTNNQMLIGLMRAISSTDLSVPEDISVASIDDFSWSEAFDPSLTVVRQPIEDMAKASFSMLATRIDGEALDARAEVFEPTLIIRGSCAAPSH